MNRQLRLLILVLAMSMTMGAEVKSCEDVLKDDPNAGNGVYNITTAKGEKAAVYCHVNTINGCGKGPWTLVMKADGAKYTFTYRSHYWTNDEVFHPENNQGLDSKETKSVAYMSPLTRICIGLRTNGKINWLTIDKQAESLFDLIADGKYRPIKLGREKWKALIPGSSLQRNCNKEGFNCVSKGANVRIGIFSNQENNCDSPDSRIGIGCDGSYCGQDNRNPVGNEARCSSDNGDKSIKSFGFILTKNYRGLGSKVNPAKSCRDIKEKDKGANSGKYFIKDGHGGSSPVYCHMESIIGCGEGPWTLVIKANGNKGTFSYDSKYWKNKDTYNADDGASLDGDSETKSIAYSMSSMNKVCLGMVGSSAKHLSFIFKANSLYEVIKDGEFHPTKLGRNAWKSLIAGSSLQRNCNREGFNNYFRNTRVRIGIYSNQENNCDSPDSRIGIGGAGTNCGQDNSNSVGNEARCSADNGDKSIKAIGYVFVKNTDKLGDSTNPAESCQQLQDSKAKSGLYYISDGSQNSLTYCYMEDIKGCGKGPWTLIIMANGKKNTFSYDSAYWTNKKEYEPNNAIGGLDDSETKTASYWTEPFSEMCLGMKVGDSVNWLKLNIIAASVHSLIADGQYRKTNLGRNAWKSLISGSSLQRNCNREGFNNYFRYTRVRIGIYSNQENNCDSPDSRIGIGGAGTYCGQDNSNSVGNEARCSADNGDKSIKAMGYVLVKNTNSLGTYTNPATSCSELSLKGFSSGAFFIRNKSCQKCVATLTYCLIVKDEGCDDGPWTLVLKADGRKKTFTYDSELWTNRKEYLPNNAMNGLDDTEMKSSFYWTTSFQKICLGMRVGVSLKFLQIKEEADSLHDLIADGQYCKTTLGRDAWKSLIPGSSLQRNCNREGFDIRLPGTRVRIGICSNQEINCNSPDSRIGIGGAGNYCGQDNNNSVGNEARCSADNGNKSIKAMGYVLIR